MIFKTQKTNLLALSLALCSTSVFAQWTNKTIDGNTLHDVYCMPGTNTAWVSGEGTIKKTTDGGATWTSLTSPTTGGLLSVFFLNDNTGWATSGGGIIFKTTDGGATWTASDTGSGLLFFGVKFWDANNGIAGSEFAQIARTTDGGNTWTMVGNIPISSNPYPIRETELVGPTSAIMAGQFNRVVRTDDQGQTFAYKGWSGGGTIEIEGLHFPTTSVGYAVGQNNVRMIKSVDGGDTWTNMTTAVNTGVSDVNLFDVWFIDANIGLVCGDQGRIRKTTDGGATWTTISVPTTAHLYDIEFWNASNGICTGANGVVLRTTDGGNTWTLISEGYSGNYRGLSVLSANELFASGNSGAIRRSTNGASSFTGQASGTGNIVLDIAMKNSTAGVASGQSGVLRYTTNGGNTWNSVTPPSGGAWLNGVSWGSSSNVVWVAGSSRAIIKSTNGGASWVSQQTGSGEFRNIFALDDNFVVATGDNGLCMRTTDGGTTWSTVTMPTTSSIYAVYFVNSSLGFAGADNGTLMKTTNGGVSWTTLTSGTFNAIKSIYFTSATEGRFVGDGGLIRKTTDGGTTWTTETSGTTQQLNEIQAVGGGAAWYAIGNGGVVLQMLQAPEINVQGNNQNIVSGDVTPSAADFTNMIICTGNSTLARSFTIQNTGVVDLSVTGITSSHPNFVVSGISFPATVAAGGNTTFTITYNHTTGSPTSNISIANNDSDENPYTFTVSGGVNTAITSTLSTTPVSCHGACDGIATVTAAGGSGGFTYAWAATTGSQTTSTATGLCYGAYNVTMTDAAGCYAVRQFININQPQLINIAVSTVDAGCNNNAGQITTTVTGGVGGYTYAWSNGGNTANIVSLSGGNYTVTVTDASGCTITKNAYVNNTCFTSTVTPTNITTCVSSCTGSATVNVTGGIAPYTYLWSNGGTAQTIDNLCKATYKVTVTDANGATTSASAAVTFTAMSVTATTTPVSCNSINNICDGTATINAAGGQAPYTYAWVNGQTTQTATGLCYGAYRVTVTSTNGCVVVKTGINVSQPPAILLTTSSTPSSCAIDGTASVTQTNGVGPFSYMWSNGGTTNTIMGLAAGTYTVTVTDANGCFRSKSVSVANACGAKPTEDTDMNADIALLEEEEVNSNENTDAVEVANDLNESLRLNDFPAVDVFNVFPNPNNGQFTIDIQLAAETDARIRIQDALGRTLYEENLQGQFFRLPIDANQWTAGAYFVQLISAQGQTTRKVVITN